MPPVDTNLAVKYRRPTELKPYKNNARTHSKRQLRQIADSIATFGFTNPVLIDHTDTVVAGHGRVEAAKLLGMEVAGGGEEFCELVAGVVGGAEDGFELAGDEGELGGVVEGVGVGDGASDLGEVQREGEQRGELGGNGLGGGDADLGAGVGGDGAGREAGDGRADDIADGEGLGALGDEFSRGF